MTPPQLLESDATFHRSVRSMLTAQPKIIPHRSGNYDSPLSQYRRRLLLDRTMVRQQRIARKLF